MGDDEAGLAPHQGTHRLLNLDLRPRVHVRGRFIQNQHICVEEHGARDGQQLFLPLGYIHTVLIEDRIVAFRQTGDIRMDPGGFGGRLHFRPGGVLFAIGDVVEYRPVKEPSVLQDHGIGKPQALSGHLPYLMAVEADASGVGIVKTHEEIDDGGFSRPGRAHDGHQISRLGPQVQIVDHGFIRQIAEPDMRHFHLASDIGQHSRFCPVLRFGRARR